MLVLTRATTRHSPEDVILLNSVNFQFLNVEDNGEKTSQIHALLCSILNPSQLTVTSYVRVEYYTFLYHSSSYFSVFSFVLIAESEFIFCSLSHSENNEQIAINLLIHPRTESLVSAYSGSWRGARKAH
jgi:hypothetical protein